MSWRMLETKYVDDKIEILVTIRDHESVINLKSPTAVDWCNDSQKSKSDYWAGFLFDYES